jgi:FkbH-like protein
MSKPIHQKLLRSPNELSITYLKPRRVLIIGSCLSENWANRMRALPEPCESDIYLVSRPLPEMPDRPLEDYDFQIIQLGLRFVLPDASYARLSQTDVDGHKKLFMHALTATKRGLASAMRWNKHADILTFVFPFLTPVLNPVGRLMPRYDLRNPIYFVEKLNEAISAELAAYRNAYLFDLNEVYSYHGRRFVQEDVLIAFNHGGLISNFDFQHDQCRLEPVDKAFDLIEEQHGPVFQAAWQELLTLYRSVSQIDMVKMVVIDLDDTLWRGVIADSQVEDMPTSEGWPKGFWEALLFLKRRGILLAIISKNEEVRVREFWPKILRRHMSLEDFAITRINWKTKPENLAEILAQVNLLPDNVLFIDDNPVERASIKAMFPSIRVLGGTPLTWRRILLWSAETQVSTITSESATRTQMVQAQISREEQRGQMSHDDFLLTLNLAMSMFELDGVHHPRFPRVLELINKTNQFNTTGRRWTQQECVAAITRGTAFFAIELSDRFTDYGLIGVLVLDEEGIRQFVMSCRVMGLGVEIAAVAQVINVFHLTGAASLVADMVPTSRNLPCRNLYEVCGFSPAGDTWLRSTTPPLPIPAHIKLSSPGLSTEAVSEALRSRSSP